MTAARYASAGARAGGASRMGNAGANSPENAKAWKALVDDLFGVDLTGGCD